MKISTKGRYALEALTCLAREENGAHMNMKSISERMGVTERYLEQIFFILRKRGILGARRGAAGGYYIAGDVERLTALEVINAVEGVIVPVACVHDKQKCPSGIYGACATRRLWSDITQCIYTVLGGITIAALARRYKEMEANT